MVKYYHDWDKEGAIVMEDPKTIDIYLAWGKASKEYVDFLWSNPNSDSYELGKKVDDSYKRVVEECDPQEVYFHEWNNHECMFTDDTDAMKVVVRLFGTKAGSVKRIRRGKTIKQILKDNNH